VPKRKRKQRAGAPPWMATFADLAVLLMCFFVLLLSFSELDVQKYRQIVGSMKNAFGVQREVFARESPKGTSFVAQEFSPGKPDPTPINIIQQQTAPEQRPFVDVRTEGDPQSRTDQPNDGFPRSQNEPGALDAKSIAEEESQARTRLDAERLRFLLREEIAKGQVEVEHDGSRITISIREKGSFPSGQATLIEPFTPVLRKIGKAISEIPGGLTVSGHTDNLPIATERFRSNWELSAARAVTVVHKLIDEGDVQPGRLTIEGYADTRPVETNATAAGRARNRRVEINIVQGEALAGSRSVDNLTQEAGEP
jgi:chemotaxis protein MotB